MADENVCVCRRCAHPYGGWGDVSRANGEAICGLCGRHEAAEWILTGQVTAPSAWPVRFDPEGL